MQSSTQLGYKRIDTGEVLAISGTSLEWIKQENPPAFTVETLAPAPVSVQAQGKCLTADLKKMLPSMQVCNPSTTTTTQQWSADTLQTPDSRVGLRLTSEKQEQKDAAVLRYWERVVPFTPIPSSWVFQPPPPPTPRDAIAPLIGPLIPINNIPPPAWAELRWLHFYITDLRSSLILNAQRRNASDNVPIEWVPMDMYHQQALEVFISKVQPQGFVNKHNTYVAIRYIGNKPLYLTYHPETNTIDFAPLISNELPALTQLWSVPRLYCAAQLTDSTAIQLVANTSEGAVVHSNELIAPSMYAFIPISFAPASSLTSPPTPLRIPPPPPSLPLNNQPVRLGPLTPESAATGPTGPTGPAGPTTPTDMTTGSTGMMTTTGTAGGLRAPSGRSSAPLSNAPLEGGEGATGGGGGTVVAVPSEVSVTVLTPGAIAGIVIACIVVIIIIVLLAVYIPKQKSSQTNRSKTKRTRRTL